MPNNQKSIESIKSADLDSHLSALRQQKNIQPNDLNNHLAQLRNPSLLNIAPPMTKEQAIEDVSGIKPKNEQEEFPTLTPEQIASGKSTLRQGLPIAAGVLAAPITGGLSIPASIAVAGGTGLIGSAGDQILNGENPLRLHNLEESGENALINAAGEGTFRLLPKIPVLNGIVKPAARVVENHIIPSLKSLPYVGKFIHSAENAPTMLRAIGKGALVGGSWGSLEDAVRGEWSPKRIARDALIGAGLSGGFYGINKLARPIAGDAIKDLDTIPGSVPQNNLPNKIVSISSDVIPHPLPNSNLTFEERMAGIPNRESIAGENNGSTISKANNLANRLNNRFIGTDTLAQRSTGMLPRINPGMVAGTIAGAGSIPLIYETARHSSVPSSSERFLPVNTKRISKSSVAKPIGENYRGKVVDANGTTQGDLAEAEYGKGNVAYNKNGDIIYQKGGHWYQFGTDKLIK